MSTESAAPRTAGAGARARNGLLLTVFGLVVFVPASYSQSVLYTSDGDSPGDHFGFSVGGGGDVNGDGINDWIVGAYRDDNNGQDSGSARVFSGLDGGILYTFDGKSADDLFGYSVSIAGDVNGDGFADLIVGAPGDDNLGTNSGSARLISGKDGKILYTLFGDASPNVFGTSVSGAGDVNGDGFDDLIIGSPGAHMTGQLTGSARVVSGVNGKTLYTFDGDAPGDLFGSSVSGAGDVNGDGFDDLIVGAHGADRKGPNFGLARVFSGADGSVLHTLDGNSSQDGFGYSVSGAGDVNADGSDDLIVGAWLDDTNGQNAGSAHVFSGVDGRILYTFYGDSDFVGLGLSVSGGGDVNGDGYADLLVGAPFAGADGTSSGMVQVFSGMDGSLLFSSLGDSAVDAFAYSISCAGDVNGDGFDDLIVGAFGDDNNGTESGSVRVISGCDILGMTYCSPAVTNSTGKSALISACGSPLADGGYFMLQATQMPTGRYGYFVASQTQAFIPQPGGSQGNLCLGGQVGRFVKQVKNTGSVGTFTILVDLTSIPLNPSHTVLAGETWNFQAWFRDKNPGDTSNFTDAVSVIFQ